LSKLSADGELEFHAGKKLELEWEQLVLEVGWNGQIALSLWQEVGDLVVEVLDLAFAEKDELEIHTDRFLVGVLRLELVDLFLDGSQQALEMLFLLRRQVILLELVL
jgi:hypothetical protein